VGVEDGFNESAARHRSPVLLERGYAARRRRSPDRPLGAGQIDRGVAVFAGEADRAAEAAEPADDLFGAMTTLATRAEVHFRDLALAIGLEADGDRPEGP